MTGPGSIPLLFHVAYSDGRPADAVWLAGRLRPTTDVEILRLVPLTRDAVRALEVVAFFERHLDDQDGEPSSAVRFARVLDDPAASVELSDLETMVARIRIELESSGTVPGVGQSREQHAARERAATSTTP